MSRILIIDDDKIHVNIVTKSFKRMGYEVFSCLNNLRTLEAIIEYSPDIILLDYEMPYRNGLVVLQEIRTKYNSVELPIIIVSGRDDENIFIQCLESGANDYLLKPFNIKIGAIKINNLLDIKDGVASQKLNIIKTIITSANHYISNKLCVIKGNVTILDDQINPIIYSKIIFNIDLIGKVLKDMKNLDLDSKLDKYDEFETIFKL